MADIEIILPERDDIAQDFRDAWRARSVQADPDRPVDVGQGTLPHKLGEVVADIELPLYANHDKILRGSVVRGKTGDALLRYAAERLPANVDGSYRLPATGGSGFAEATKIVAGGAYIIAGTILLHQPTGFRYQVVVSDTYLDGDAIPIVGIDTGSTTNLAADAPLVFDSPPPGVSTGAIVLAQNDGTGALVGLTGGRGEETDVELQDRVIAAQSDPPAAGNSAEIVQQAQRTAAVPVQAAFVIPAWFGPGSSCVGFTLRSDISTTRIPNSTQRGLVAAQLGNAFPTDYSIPVAIILPQTFTVALGVTWITGARGWTDRTPWPEYLSADPVHVDDSASTITSNSFQVTTTVPTTSPQVGQTIAVFDAATRKFKRKRISAVTTITPTLSWLLEFSISNGASETFIPAVDALVSPYSVSLSRLVTPLITYVTTLGPGEQFATFPDPGGRQRRWPYSPDTYSSIVTNDGLVGVGRSSGATSDVEVLLPSTPFTTTVGTPGVTMYLLQLADFAVYPQT